MKRRGFLRSLAAALVTAVIVPPVRWVAGPDADLFGLEHFPYATTTSASELDALMKEVYAAPLADYMALEGELLSMIENHGVDDGKGKYVTLNHYADLRVS